jgi:hypothetical protein
MGTPTPDAPSSFPPTGIPSRRADRPGGRSFTSSDAATFEQADCWCWRRAASGRRRRRDALFSCQAPRRTLRPSGVTPPNLRPDGQPPADVQHRLSSCFLHPAARNATRPWPRR